MSNESYIDKLKIDPNLLRPKRGDNVSNTVILNLFYKLTHNKKYLTDISTLINEGIDFTDIKNGLTGWTVLHIAANYLVDEKLSSEEEVSLLGILDMLVKKAESLDKNRTETFMKTKDFNGHTALDLTRKNSRIYLSFTKVGLGAEKALGTSEELTLGESLVKSSYIGQVSMKESISPPDISQLDHESKHESPPIGRSYSQ